MWLPTKQQIDSAVKSATLIAGTAVAIFGLQAKGITTEQVQGLIKSLGDTVNTVVVMIGAAATLYSSVQAVRGASATNQVANVLALAKDPKQARSATQALLSATIALPQVQTIVTDGATAQASPSDDVVSKDQVRVIENASGQPLNKK